MNDIVRNLLLCLVEINQWETSSLPAVNTTIGRHVYFSIIKEILLRTAAEDGDRSLKQVLAHPAYTDRAIRLKLREMEGLGLLRTTANDSDKRARIVEPTEEFISMMETHSQIFSSIVNKNFLLLEK